MKKEAPTTTTTAKPEQPTVVTQPSKQMQVLDNLKKGWLEKKVDISKLTATPDGKFLNIQVAPDWPIVQIGPSAGVSIPALKSYQSAYDAAMDAKALLERQNARSQKKSAPVVVKVVSNVQPDAKKEQSTVPVQKKGKPVQQHAQA
jgi:hypothetical protein